MSLLRQSEILTEFDPPRGTSIATLAYEYPSGYQVPDHAHTADQLIYAVQGLMEVSSGRSVWLIPPHFALWIPARTRHRINMLGPVSMRTLYLRVSLAARAERGVVVLHVTPLLRELILETVRVGRLHVRRPYDVALRELFVAQLQKASPIPTVIMLPQEKRAFAVAQAVLRNPADPRSMATLCAGIGVGVRTIERTFRSEVGVSFESWRRQVRLMKAVELLIAGSSIKEVAFKIGYRQSSAFVEMFRRTFGTTPKVWLSTLNRMQQLHPS